MKKERLETFFDAVLAIIMTILVLDLKQPETPSLQGLWDLREHYFVYAISFFWCATMWVNTYRQWHTIKRVNGNVLWLAMLVLFFSSLVPYVTSYAGENFNSGFAEGLYGTVILLVSLARLWMNREVAKINPDNSYVRNAYPVLEKWAIIDIAIKMLGVILTVAIWPWISTWMIILGTSLYSIMVTKMENKYDHPDRWLFEMPKEE